MRNLNNDFDFDTEEGSEGGENFSALGYHKDDDNESDFDLNEDVDTEVSGPVFTPAAASSDEDVELNEDEEETLEEIEKELEDDEGESENKEMGDEAESSFTEISPLVEALEDEEDDSEEEIEEKGTPDSDNLVIPRSKIILARQLLENIQQNNERLISLFGSLIGDSDEERISIAEMSDGLIADDEEAGSVIEGVFNGENMIGPDGKEYSVPPNYASKSKLVEGDILKLTITDRGTFIYKQTKPVERKRVIGKLEKDAEGNYFVTAEKKKYRVITASITYYKGIAGDKVVILLPLAGDSTWAAVENIIKSK